MMTKRKGEKRLIVAPHRYSTEPKVHKYVYNQENRAWFPLCTVGSTWRQYHGEVVDTIDLAVTCKKCGITEGDPVQVG